MPFTTPENPRPVRAKMYVESVTARQWGTSIRLQVVSRGEDNKEWSAASPAGTLEMTIKNEAASDQFAPGQEWFIDMIPIASEKTGAEGME